MLLHFMHVYCEVTIYTGVISGSVRFNVIVVSSLHSAGHSDGGLASLRSVDLQEVRQFVWVYTCVYVCVNLLLGCVYLLGSICGSLTDS